MCCALVEIQASCGFSKKLILFFGGGDKFFLACAQYVTYLDDFKMSYRAVECPFPIWPMPKEGQTDQDLIYSVPF